MNNLPVPASVTMRGLHFLNLAMDDAINAIEAALVARQPTRIAFVNADCINIAATNRDYRKSMASMDWVFVDGIGMRIAGRLLQQPIRDNVNGTDLFPRLCEVLARNGQRLYLLGARPGLAAATAAWASEHFPGLQIAGTQDGYYAPSDEAHIVANIRASRADVLLVALGAPRQEAWIEKHMAACNTTIAIGVGGLFDYYGGRIPRAPLWMRRIGIEWIFRLLQEPARLGRRYVIGNVVFLLRISQDWIRHHGLNSVLHKLGLIRRS